MSYQIYLVSILYLLLGSAFLLIDEYGGRYLMLIRLRHVSGSSPILFIVLTLLGILLLLLKIFFPITPGPPLIGDLSVVIGHSLLILYYLTQAVKVGRKRKKSETNPKFTLNHQEVLQKTGSIIELHKRNLGFMLIGVATLHFLFPSAVLL